MPPAPSRRWRGSSPAAAMSGERETQGRKRYCMAWRSLPGSPLAPPSSPRTATSSCRVPHRARRLRRRGRALSRRGAALAEAAAEAQGQVQRPARRGGGGNGLSPRRASRTCSPIRASCAGWSGASAPTASTPSAPFKSRSPRSAESFAAMGDAYLAGRIEDVRWWRAAPAQPHQDALRSLPGPARGHRHRPPRS